MIQIHMEMPDSCRECWFLNYDMYSGRTSCAIEDMTLAQYFKALDFEGRHEECPLREVVTCGECKHWYQDADTGMACEYTNMSQPEDGFCNWREKKNDSQ